MIEFAKAGDEMNFDGVEILDLLGPRTHKIVIEEFCQIGRLEIKFGRLEII